MALTAKLNRAELQTAGEGRRLVMHDQCSECIHVETGPVVLPVKEQRDRALRKSGGNPTKPQGEGSTPQKFCDHQNKLEKEFNR